MCPCKSQRAGRALVLLTIRRSKKTALHSAEPAAPSTSSGQRAGVACGMIARNSHAPTVGRFQHLRGLWSWERRRLGVRNTWPPIALPGRPKPVLVAPRHRGCNLVATGRSPATSLRPVAGFSVRGQKAPAHLPLVVKGFPTALAYRTRAHRLQGAHHFFSKPK